MNDPPFSVIPAVLTALRPKTAAPPTNVDDCDVMLTVAVAAAETKKLLPADAVMDDETTLSVTDVAAALAKLKPSVAAVMETEVMLTVIAGVVLAAERTLPHVNVIDGPVASHVSDDDAPAVSCATIAVEVVEMVDPENVNDAIDTCGTTNMCPAPRNDELMTETESTEMPLATEMLGVLAVVGASTELVPSEMDTVDTAAAALTNSAVVVTVSADPTSEKVPDDEAVTETVVAPITVDDVPISVTDPAPPPYRRFCPEVLSVVETTLSSTEPLITPPTVTVCPAAALTVPHDEIVMVLVPRTLPVRRFDPAAEMVDDAKEIDSPDTVAVVTKFDAAVAVSTAEPAAVSVSPTRLVACT